ncbi:MAG: GDSL-type esterase/lipase family protein [Flavobacteriaceae bacterium]|nr:GDSL-type esterase/lipase family protein [Flavobacteriaceae bacterium]
MDNSQKEQFLIGSAASVEFLAQGKKIDLIMNGKGSTHNYISIEVNGTYDKRYKIINGEEDTIITLDLPENENRIGIYKATEAASGEIIFKGIHAEKLLPLPIVKPSTIEFIGNSITCGALADDSLVPCGQGEYHDQHNAYLAYGPRTARALNVNYIMSAVSGIGIYRNWNDEHIREPIMPEVYENLYLNPISRSKYVSSPAPDVITICLGTNDLSDGDGMNPRLPFNPEIFTKNYIKFVEMLFRHYPKTRVALLNSPMVSAEKSAVLSACLEAVKRHFEKQHTIQIFSFTLLQPGGCNYHPGIEDHKAMSNELIPFLKEFLNEPVNE